ncbi:MAG: glycine zipper 2TM domain-containing protein [Novosphingobium sp.]
MVLAAAGLALGLAAPASAHPEHDALPPHEGALDAGRDDGDHPPMGHPMTHPGMGGAHMPPPAHREHWDRMRGDWLEQCRARTGWRVERHDDGLGGALIGGLAGGVIGNRVAGRGDRLVGTVIGAAAGAAVGVAIDKAEDRGRDYNRDTRGDYCEQYFDYYTQAGHSGGWGGWGYGYAQPMMMVPVMMAQGHGHGRDCTETVVTEKWVTVPARRRHIVRDKRVRVAPDKRLPMK